LRRVRHSVFPNLSVKKERREPARGRTGVPSPYWQARFGSTGAYF
jgi:hypothetical protein